MGLRRILTTQRLDSALCEPYRSMSLSGDGFVMSDHDDGQLLVLVQRLQQIHDASTGAGV